MSVANHRTLLHEMILVRRTVLEQVRDDGASMNRISNRITFAKGASLKDPARLFNSSLDGNARRATDIHEGEEVDESAFEALVRQAVALNSSGKSIPSKKAT